jgi:TldD protein
VPSSPPARGVDPGFTALPLHELAAAALARADELGCTYADLRVERIREGVRTFRDHSLESSLDHTTVGLAVRVVHDGVWGFASGVGLTTSTAAALAGRAVATAKVSKPLTPHRVELADEQVHRDATWVSAYETDPFTVDEAERQGRMLELSGATRTSSSPTSPAPRRPRNGSASTRS